MQLLLRDRQQHRNSMGGCKGGGGDIEKRVSEREREVVRGGGGSTERFRQIRRRRGDETEGARWKKCM